MNGKEGRQEPEFLLGKTGAESLLNSTTHRNTTYKVTNDSIFGKRGCYVKGLEEEDK